MATKGPSPKKQVQLSVQEVAEADFASEAPIVFHLARVADEAPQYWSTRRDTYLDGFWKTEPLLAGAIYSMCAKVAALDFRITGPHKSKVHYKNLLLSADFGGGWVNFVPKVVQDLLCQDNGAFIELLRPKGVTESSPVRGIAHIDAQLCERTGNPLTPVKFHRKGKKPLLLKWWQLVSFADMQSPRREHKGRGFCAVSRVLRAAQTLRDIGIHKRQKLAGKRVPAIMFVQGIRRNAVMSAVEKALEGQRTKGESLYTAPVVIASPDPGRPVEVQLIELAGLPENYDEDTTLKWYIATLALDFGTDYSEFAPLPGGGLGTSTQSTEMAARARGKGPGLVLQQFEFGVNWFILPPKLTFQFASTDPMAERERIDLRLLRARERALRIQSGELSPAQALMLAVEEGDAPSSFIEGDGDDEGIDRFDVIAKELSELMDAWGRAEDMMNHKPKVVEIK